MKDELLTWRNEFPILGKKTYLISNSLGAMPVGVYDRMRQYADTWSTKGVTAWADEWWNMPVEVGNTIAPLIGAKIGEVSMHPNITIIESIVLSCFEREEDRNGRKKVVCEDLNFPSVLYLLHEWSDTHGMKLHLVKSDDGIGIDTEKMVEAIDEQTLLVPISHVLFKSAYIQDAKAIIEKAHRVGAYVVLDVYQSVGILPVDVQELRPDFLIGGVLKWLCGGPGGCFLYVRPDLRKKVEPRFTGWMAHKRPFGFERTMDLREDAFRFLNGTPVIPALYAATEGVKIIQQLGVDQIRVKSIHQTTLLVELADKMGCRVNSPRRSNDRGGTVTIDVPNGYEVSRELIARNILVDYREGAGVRLAPHFYNSDEEVVHAMGQMREILETRAYEKHRRVSSIVT